MTGGPTSYPESPAERSPPEDPDLADLLAALARIDAVREPMGRAYALLKEAERRGMGVEDLRALFDAYLRSRKHRRWRLERVLQGTERWLRRHTLFKVLGYVGSLAVLVAVVSFFFDLPDQRRQRNHQLWQLIQEAEGRAFDSQRVEILERLNDACFSLEGLKAPGAHLEGVRLDGCSELVDWHLLGNWTREVLRVQGAVVQGADLSQAFLVGARLNGADLAAARLAGAWLEAAELHKASLRGADLSGADLFRADLRGADLAGANLEGAELSQANLQGANLRRARLGGAVLVRANLRRVTLDYAGCTGANFAGADLRGSRFYGAILANASLRKARLDRLTSLDESDLTEADFTGVRLPDVRYLANADNWRSARLPTAEAGRKQAPPTVALVLIDTQHFFQEIRRGADRASHEVDARLRVHTLSQLGGGIEAERAVVEGEIAAGADAIVLVPQHQIDSLPSVAEAFRAGVEPVCYDQCGFDPEAGRYFVAGFESDQRELGRSTGRYLGSWLRSLPAGAAPAKLAIVRACRSEGCFRRVEGFRAGLDESRARVTEVAYRTPGPDQTPQELARLVLRENPEATILWSANEAGTVATVEAVYAAGRAGEVEVFGTDLSPELARMLLDDRNVLQAVTAQVPEEMGYQATRAALAALRGDAPPYRRNLVEHRLLARGNPADVRWLQGLVAGTTR